MVPSSIAPDGTLLFEKLVAGGREDIVYLPRGEGSEIRDYLATPAGEFTASFSPDGRVVAYVSDVSGRPELYVDGFPEPKAARRVSADGAAGSIWRSDGRELYFGVGRTMFACEVKTQPSLEVGKPRVLFELPKEVRGVAARPDGSGFYLLVPVGQNPSSLTVVQNWAAQLEKHE